MSFWTWAIPLATFAIGVLVTQQEAREAKGKLSDANDRIKELQDELDDARADLRYQTQQREMWENEAMSRTPRKTET